jgi:hypothetical protein
MKIKVENKITKEEIKDKENLLNYKIYGIYSETNIPNLIKRIKNKIISDKNINKKKIKERIDLLYKNIKIAEFRYRLGEDENEGIEFSIYTDYEFDKLDKELRILEKYFPEYKQENSPTEQTGISNIWYENFI